MIPQVAQQQVLSSARGVEVVYIVEMLLYSDAAGLTIAERLRFSTVALAGFTDAEDGVTLDCLTYLSSIPRVPEDRMFHFPSEVELTESSLRKSMVFDLVNAKWGTGVRLSTFFEGLNINFARVKMMKLYLPLGTMNAHKRLPIDVSGFESGSERVLFRGEVGTPSYGEEVLSFAATTRPIESRALVLNDDDFLISALGKRVPQPYGSGVIVEGIRMKSPQGTVLNQRINNPTVTGFFDVTTDEDLPTAGTYFVSIEGESGVLCNGIAASRRIDIQTRGSNASSHETASPIILEASAVDPIWAVAPFEIADVTDVLLGSTIDDAIEVDPADFTFTNPDTVAFPGETLATIEITTTKLLELFPQDPLSVKLLVRLDGRIVPFEIESAYDFDDDANWNDDPTGVHASVNAGGRHYQEVSTPYDQNAVNTETQSGWGTDNCLVTVSTTRIQGQLSVEARRDAGGLNIYGIDRAVSLPFPNLTSPGPLFICNIRLDHPGGLGDVVSVGVLVGNSAGVNDIFGFTVSNFSNRTWKTIICERGRRTGSQGGGMVGATITYIKVFVSSGFPGQGFQLDKIQTVDTTDMIAQKNDLANIDMASANNFYEVFLKALRPEWIDTLTLSISADTLAGTTPPTNFHEIDFAGLTSVWERNRETATPVGAPTVTAIESIRFEVTLKGTNVYQQVVSHTGQLWAAGASIDTLGRAVNPGTPYVGGLPGQTITHPADVIRLHLQENGGIPEANIDLDGLADIVSSIGSGAAWAFNMSTLGFSFEAILLRLCWEAGVNVILAEEVDRQLFRLLIGNGSVADYGFDAAGQIIDVTDYRVQQIHPRSREILFTDYLMLFALESALESVDDTSFLNVIQASVRRNDISAFVPTDRFTAAEDRYGKRILQGPIYSFCIADPATAQERLGREVTYRMDERPLLRINVESWVGATLELGDIVTVQDRMAAEVDGTPKARKMRVLAISQSDLGTPTTLIEVD